jgi:methionyl aminopeptidase
MGSKLALKLVQVAERSFWAGVEQIKEGARLSDISHAIQEYVEKNGFSVVREYQGHGIGTSMHEEPGIPNYGKPGRGPRLAAGMTLAIEPMINSGSPDIMELGDGWTVVTADGGLSAHYENTVLVTKDGAEVLTIL